jgi:hypothetical protein
MTDVDIPSDAQMTPQDRLIVDDKYEEDRALERLEDYQTDVQPVEDDPAAATA